MPQRFLNRLRTKINSAYKAFLTFVALVAHHILLASLFYLPRCMQARARDFVQGAKFLQEQYLDSWTFENKSDFWRQIEIAESQIGWLNEEVPHNVSVRGLKEGWGKHIEYSQSKWTKILGLLIPVSIALIDISAQGHAENQVLVSLLLIRGIFAAFHLVAFHNIIYPKVRDLDFLMKCLPDIDEISSPLWLALSLPLASIHWSIMFALALTIRFACCQPSPDDQSLHFTAYLLVISIFPEIFSFPWIYYKFNHLE